MTTLRLAALHDLITRLDIDHGVRVVCVGGAARDTFLGREPKDYDLVVLSPTANEDDLRSALLEASGAFSIAELGQHDIENYVNKDDDRGLRNVFELDMPIKAALGSYKPDCITVQVLVFSEAVTQSYANDPYNVVEDHDCDLNKAWLENVGGVLRARVHPEFPSIFTGNTNSFKPGYSDHERKAYMKSKFPEFNHI